MNQTTTTIFAGSLANSATFVKSNSGSLEFDGAPTLNSGSSFSVNGGTLKFNVTAGSPQVQSSVTATVVAGANLELAGSISALSDAATGAAPTQRVNITSAGTLTITKPISGSAVQRIGGIDPLTGAGGRVVLGDGANLTANHINQNSLVIGANSTFTIAASDALGNPLAELAANSFAQLSNDAIAPDPTTAAPTFSVGDGENGAIATPEPSGIALMACGAVGLLVAARKQRCACATGKRSLTVLL